MKKLLVLLNCIAFMTTIQAKNLSAVFSYCSFDVPGQSPYIETYLHVTGSSVKFKSTGSSLQGQIEVQWVLKSNDKIVHFDKYNLNSPEIKSTDSLIPDFIDQQRVMVTEGNYKLELSIRDKNSESNELTLTQDLKISFPKDTISISDIEFVESYQKSDAQGKFTKSGYDIIPCVNSFFPKEMKNLRFYAEIYRSDITPGDDYLVRYYISRFESNRLLENYIVNMKQKPQATNVVMGDLPIEELLSGNYNLNIEVRNKKNEVIAYKSTMFQRSNQQNKPMVTAEISNIDTRNTFVSQYLNKDTLAEYISSLYPISTSLEADAGERQIRDNDLKSMQQFLYYFWNKRNPDDPEGAWYAYMEEVDKVNTSYSAQNKKGYETDRGRVYLQYGPPNIVADGKNEPAAYPYEIWQYYKLETQSNRKFIFYAKEQSTNDFILLHSDAQGELQEPNWHAFLFNRTQQFGIDLDRDKAHENYGGHADEKFDNPH